MRNYQKSDYALNKRHPEAIVYRFADRIVRITLADYLAENPDKSEADFRFLKQLSDTLYLEDDRKEYNQTRKNVPLHDLEVSDAPLEEAFIDALDREMAREAFCQLIANDGLTQAQERRFRLHCFGGLTFREVAEREGITLRAAEKSIYAATDALKKTFADFSE